MDDSRTQLGYPGGIFDSIGLLFVKQIHALLRGWELGKKKTDPTLQEYKSVTR
jgi:hypothetical protein